MIIPIFYIAITTSIIGLIIATYTDLKERIVPNKLNYGLAITGIILYAIQSTLEGTPTPLIYSALGLFSGFLFGWMMWKIGVFAGGDVKLFMGLGALNPFTPALIKIGTLTNAQTPLFPITLFIYSLIAFLPYGIFVVIYKIAKNKKFQKELYQETKPQIKYAIHASIFASATYTILINTPFIAQSTILTIILLIIWGLLGKNKKYATLIILISAIILNPILLIEALITAMIFGVILYTIIKLLFSTRKILTSEIPVKNLEEGMIPAKSIYKLNGKIVEEKTFNINTLIMLVKKRNLKELEEILKPKKEIISSRKARGLTIEEIREVKELAKKGKMPGRIRIKESMPFVPTMLIGYILCLIFGDFIFLILIRGI